MHSRCVEIATVILVSIFSVTAAKGAPKNAFRAKPKGIERPECSGSRLFGVQNLLNNTTVFDNAAYWIPSSTTGLVVPNESKDPCTAKACSGEQTAELFVESTNGTFAVFHDFPAEDGEDYVFSVFVKRGSADVVFASITDQVTPFASGLNTSFGVHLSVIWSGGFAIPTTGSLIAISDFRADPVTTKSNEEWVRLKIYMRYPNPSGKPFLRIAFGVEGPGSATFWGAQLERGTRTASPFVP